MILLLLACAGPEPAECAAGFSYRPGCDAPGGYATPDPEVCYRGCAGEGDPACEAGTACREAWVDPCGGEECLACGGTAWLCFEG